MPRILSRERVGALLLVVLLWSLGFLMLSDKTLAPAKRSCGELQQVVIRLSQREASPQLPALVDIQRCRSIDSGDLARHYQAEYAATGTLRDGSEIPIQLYYGQDGTGTRVYALERHDEQGQRLAVQTVPRNMEPDWQFPTAWEHAFLALGVLAVLLYSLRGRKSSG